LFLQANQTPEKQKKAWDHVVGFEASTVHQQQAVVPVETGPMVVVWQHVRSYSKAFQPIPPSGAVVICMRV